WEEMVKYGIGHVVVFENEDFNCVLDGWYDHNFHSCILAANITKDFAREIVRGKDALERKIQNPTMHFIEHLLLHSDSHTCPSPVVSHEHFNLILKRCPEMGLYAFGIMV